MRTTPFVLALAPVLLCSFACGPFQTYGQAMQLVCDAPIDCTECNQGDPSQRATLLAQYISERLYNRDAIQVFAALAYASPEDKGRLLKAAASEAGVTSCPLADVFTAP